MSSLDIGSPSSTVEESSRYSEQAAKTRRDWLSFIGLHGYCFGCFLFIIGSLLPLLDLWALGSWIFFIACGPFCATSGALLAVAAARDGAPLYAYSAALQVVGSLTFAIGSIPAFFSAYPTTGTLLLLFGGISYTIGAQMDLVQNGSFFGRFLPLFPGKLKVIPALFLNHLGGILFTIGCIMYFFPDYPVYAPSWLFLIGSIFYFVASVCTASASWKVQMEINDQANFVDIVYKNATMDIV